VDLKSNNWTGRYRGHVGASDNRRSMLFDRIRAAKALQCAGSLRRSDPAEEF
jgi:hypothetical protein